MINNIIIRTGLMSVAIAGLSACTGNYLDLNTNPYEVGKDDMSTDGYNVGAAISAMCGTVISTDVNTAQFTDCLLGGPMGGYYSTTGAFERTIDNFNPTDDWTHVFMASDRVIPTLFSNLVELQNLTEDEVVLSIGNVIKVAAMNRVTDTYGPIPYSKIGQDGALSIPYDSQQEVYNKMFDELNDAITVFTENQGRMISANADPVYGGDVDKWCRFANSLKLRLAMRIVYADHVKAEAMAEEAVSHPIGVLASNDDNASLKAIAFGDKGNPIYTAVKYNQVSGSNTGGDTHAAADITAYMNAYNDPRRPKYFIASEFTGPGQEYVGVMVSGVKPVLSKDGRKYSGVNVSPTDPLIWMNAAEVAFLKAEAKAVFDFNMGAGTAEDFYNEGIRLSFDQWGVSSSYDSYVNDENSVSVTYTDPIGVNTRTEVLTRLCVKWSEAASQEEKQERILIQKWIANYHLGNEAWADHRRTGYPKFFPASDEGNKSNGVVKNDLGARRMPYPQNERTTNAENYQKAVSELLKGSDNMGTRVWWDYKPE